MPLVVLDACILFRGKLTDILLCLAEANAFEPVWSNEIHAEWMRNLQARYTTMPARLIQRRHDAMEDAFPAANCPANPADLATITAMCSTAKQKKDAHVIATGVAANATIIVTDNIPDFSTTILARYGMIKQRPDAFCQDLFKSNPALVLAGAQAHRASMTKPPYNVDEYLSLLGGAKMGLPTLAKLLVPYKHSL